VTRDENLAALRKMFGKVADDLDPGDPVRAAGKAVGEYVTSLVGYLAVGFPNEHVNRLMAQVWDLVGSCTTPVAIGAVETPSVALIQQDGQKVLAILVPPKWLENGAKDYTMMVGSMIFCGSQAVDYYNGQLLGQGQVAADRARAYEVEALHVIQAADPSFTPNPYQTAILRCYPQGIRSKGIKLYEEKPTPANPPPAFMGVG
jgi:hypothetical protein